MPDDIAARLWVEEDQTEPDWRFYVVLDGSIVAVGYYDADNGWDRADRPLGWQLVSHAYGSVSSEPEPLALGGQILTWGAQKDAAIEALRIVHQRLTTQNLDAAGAHATQVVLASTPDEGNPDQLSLGS